MALREILAHFGFTFDRANLDAAGRGVEKVKNETSAAGKSLTGFVDGLRGAVAGIAAGAFVSFTSEIKEQAAALKDTSEQTGLSTDALQAWTLEAQLGGASAADFTAGLRKLSKELATGVDESGQHSKLFERLGIAAKDGEGNIRDLSEVLPEIAEKFAGLKTGAERSALAQQIFGRSGTKLVPILSQGAAGVARLQKQFEELGGGFSAEAIERADEYDDALLKLNFSFFGLKSLLATQVFPWLAKTVGELTRASVGAGKWLKETTAVSTAVKLLATILGGTLLKALAPFLIPGLKFLAIFLAVDDLIGFLQGKDSVIGKILNHMFGDGTATAVRSWVNDAKDAIGGLISGGFDLLKIAISNDKNEIDDLGLHFLKVTNAISDAIDKVADKLKGLFRLSVGAPEAGLRAPEEGDAATTAPANEGFFKRNTRKVFDVLGLTGSALTPEQRAKLDAGVDAARNATANVPSAAPAAAPVPATGPITNNISPITLQQTFGPGTGPEVRKLAADAAKQGVSQGLAEYRAALQNLDQRAPAR